MYDGDFFGNVLGGCHANGFSAFVMEHPLRNRVFCAQVHAGMWRRNGDAAILSSEWYRSVRWWVYASLDSCILVKFFLISSPNFLSQFARHCVRESIENNST